MGWWRDQLDPGHCVPKPGDELRDLVRRQLAALTRLGALHNLDLQLLGPDEVLGGDPEPRRGYLLDPVVGAVAVAQASIAGWILAAFARVGAGADPVHGDREGGMRLGRQGTERHGGGHEPPADLLDRLNLIERNGSAGAETEQVAEAGRPPCSILDEEVAVGIAGGRGNAALRPRPRGLLQSDYDRRGPIVVLTLFAESHPAMIGQRARRLGRLERCRMPSHHILGDLLEADSADG